MEWCVHVVIFFLLPLWNKNEKRVEWFLEKCNKYLSYGRNLTLSNGINVLVQQWMAKLSLCVHKTKTSQMNTMAHNILYFICDRRLRFEMKWKRIFRKKKKHCSFHFWPVWQIYLSLGFFAFFFFFQSISLGTRSWISYLTFKWFRVHIVDAICKIVMVIYSIRSWK